MEAKAFLGSRGVLPLVYTSPQRPKSMAARTPIRAANKTVSSKKNSTQVKLLTRVEQLKLLTKAEKAGLLSAAEKSGLSLSAIEKLGLLSKAEEFGVLSAATDPGTPGALLTLSLGLLLLGPLSVFLVPEDYPWEVVVQAVVAAVSVVGGSAAFGASNFVSNLQKSN
ncbi:hypothetical protein RchiOBHm_Chr7g0183201 [Rosa chinensis]|uniref:Uncharacterized protein n=1 Tax=Rosa chinensis TaxID=74649 RepID=A0A2P6P332_ROSCH|nr:uncharacterized protein LOC112178671 [Rosa chinensis]PRQ16344.1 hypothetical protein RchiOBHm_Chr7g0183201 [Rosa chinensis]